jgi:serine/threonine protein kinase/formylglycine-generating enzyme required for sulfatase activity
LEWVERHIELCDSCQQTLDRLQVGDDTFVRQIRPPKSSTDPVVGDSHQSESALRDAMEKALRNAPPSVPAAQPVAAPPAIVPPPPAQLASPAISPPAISSPTASAATSSPDANRGAFQPPRTVEEFSRLLSESRVLSAPAIQAFLNSFPTEQQPVDAQSAASLFVQAGQLTPFQVRAIFQGKHTGLMIEDHEVLDLLGRGGMGSVFKARNRRLDRIEAIKVISGKKLGTVEARQRFDREARAAARISHPNVVATYDAGEFNGISYLTMQFVDGLDLAKTVRSRGPLPVDHAVAYILQAAAGLQAAHEAGIIHRDIKPHNLLLDRQGKVRILDMGLARLSDAANMAAQEGLTQSGQMMGTIDYMSPEQTIDVRKVTAASDVYSLGCTLYFLLTGKPPFQAETMGAKLMAHHHQPPPRLIDARADIPAALEAVFQKMLAKDPAARYASMDELIVALQAYSQVEPPPPPASLIGANAPAAGVSEEIDPSMASFFAQLSAPGGKKPKAAAATPKDVKSHKEPQLLFGPAPSSHATAAPSATPVKRPATAKSESSRRDPIKLLFIATAAGLVATILFVLGIFLTVRTPEGEVVVTLGEGVTPKDVTVVLRNDGKDFQVTMKDKFRLRLREGQYQVSLASPNLQYSVNASRATIAKDQRTVLTVELVPPSPIPREARYYGGRYYLFIPDPLSRNDARQRCLSLRGRLASIDSANRNSFVAKLAEYQEAWIGHRLVGGRWLNEQDKPIGYSNWYTGEPSGGSNEPYVIINWVSPGKWNDHSDSQPGELKGFICEWNPNELNEPPPPPPPPPPPSLPGIDLSKANQILSQLVSWRYVFALPAPNWYATDFDDSTWDASVVLAPKSQLEEGKSPTKSPVWLRQRFDLSAMEVSDLGIFGVRGGDMEVYVNGVVAAILPGEGNFCQRILPSAARTISAGPTTIAIHCESPTIGLGLVSFTTGPAPISWRAAPKTPSSNWRSPDFTDLYWLSAETTDANWNTSRVQQTWSQDSIWRRGTLHVDALRRMPVALCVDRTEMVEAHINGRSLGVIPAPQTGRQRPEGRAERQLFPIDEAAAEEFKQEKRVIAVHSTDRQPGRRLTFEFVRLLPMKPIAYAGERYVRPTDDPLKINTWYDLLAETKVSEHAINGEWTRDGSAVVPKAGHYNRLIVPFVVEGDYDLRFAITPTVQNSPLGLFLPLNGATLAEAMFGGGSNRSSLPVPSSPGQQIDVPSQLIQNREQAFEVQVRGANESEVSIVVLKDGTPYLNWKGTRQQVSIPTFSTLPQPNLLGFTIWSDPVRVSHYRFRLVSGKATRWNPSVVNVDATPNSTTPTIEGYGGKRYKLSDKPVTFGEALRIARNWSGRLVTISSAQEAAWIKQTFGDKAIWLSAFRRGRSGREWVDERLRPLSYYGRWGENQPEGQDWQYSLRLAEGSHEWHDAKSDDVAHALLEWGDETASASPSVPPSPPTTDLAETVSQAKRALQTSDWARYYTADAPSTSRKDALAAALVNHAAKSNTEKVEALAACELAMEASKAGRDPWLAYEARRLALTRFPQFADDWNKRILERLALARDPNEAWLGAQVLQQLAGELLEAGQKRSLLELFPRLEAIARSKPLKDEIKRLRARVEGLIELMPPNPAEDAVGMQEWRGFAAALTRDDWNQALREFSTSARSPFATPARTLSTLDRYRGSPAVSLTIANLFRNKLAQVGKPETKSLLSAAERFWLENAALQSGAAVEPQVAERLKPTFPNVKWPLIPLDGAWNEPVLRPKAAFTGLIVPEDGNFARFNGNGEVLYETAPTSSYVHEFAVTLQGNQGSMTFNYGGHEGNRIVLFWKREENRFQWEHQHYRGGGFSWLGHGEFRGGERLEFTVYAHEGIHLSKLKNGRDAGAQYPADSLEFSIRTNDNAQGVIHFCRFREWNAIDARLLNRKLPEFELHSGSVGLEARQLHVRNLDLENQPTINNPNAFCVTASGTPMLPVPAGSHLRPGTDNYPNSLIRITKPYWLGRHEVTQAEWVRVMGTNPSRRRGSPYLPVENVNIVEAAAFCGELTKLERSRLPSGYVYRLPTEAEWERACLAPNNPAQPADVQLPTADESWNNDNSQDHPWSVGQRRANAWGFHDMVGNVAEMTADAWNDRPANNAPRFTDPYAPITNDSTIFTARGGAYWWNPSDLSPFTRRNHPAAGACSRGFRIALAPALSP